ncbi:MAG: 6-pyruvoyl tetrahydropterin synthase family protein [Phycisphaerales bacterium]|jgi:6-pyruvoyltetrahydropterin/6-carboxytetrahydropterin synthase|nr:6-pyruvoyl tetrahydropterin synthase family protein [Phycisphaerales bacterium]
MFSLQVERVFSAAHAIVIGGAREALHGHDWRVRVTVTGEVLDDDGLLCDFHLLERLVDAAIGPLRDSTLNDAPPFSALNPTAEHVAMHLASAVQVGLPTGLSMLRVAVTEAPGCEAAYTMELHR